MTQELQSPTAGPRHHPSASYSATIRVRLVNEPGMFARLAEAIGSAGGSLGAVDLVGIERGHKLRDVTVLADGEKHLHEIADAVRSVEGIEVERIADRTFQLHLGGKIKMDAKSPIRNQEDLSMAYTPGVGRVCLAVAAERKCAWSLTIKHNTVAVVSDGTAVLGLGDIGPEAAMPVMEGKAALFKEFAGVDAWPICLDTKDPDEIVRTVKAIAPGFGGVNLEDISAPRCFEIEERLRAELDIPVFHDDQHGTAIVTLAALLNALKLVGKRMEDLKVVITGVGAAGVAVTKILQTAGVPDIVGCDSKGPIHRGRDDLNPIKRAYAEKTNPRSLSGSADKALHGADVFIGLSKPGAITRDGIAAMAEGAIVFVMANPVPEVMPDEIEGHAAVIATGRSDYPNQINNVLAFPGVFRGALDVGATSVSEGMKLAAAQAIAAIVPVEELGADYIIPSVFNRAVAPAVAQAVAEAAAREGITRNFNLPAQISVN
ncbi:MAG: malic enzyme-like NAD(P)-binding protein [Gaiellaceae bacterium]